MTLELKEPRVTDRWPDCKNPEHIIEWRSPEHCALLVGFDEDSTGITHVIVNDPHTGKQERYPMLLFKQRWMEMGSQAVTVKL